MYGQKIHYGESERYHNLNAKAAIDPNGDLFRKIKQAIGNNFQTGDGVDKGWIYIVNADDGTGANLRYNKTGNFILQSRGKDRFSLGLFFSVLRKKLLCLDDNEFKLLVDSFNLPDVNVEIAVNLFPEDLAQELDGYHVILKNIFAPGSKDRIENVEVYIDKSNGVECEAKGPVTSAHNLIQVIKKSGIILDYMGQSVKLLMQTTQIAMDTQNELLEMKKQHKEDHKEVKQDISEIRKTTNRIHKLSEGIVNGIAAGFVRSEINQQVILDEVQLMEGEISQIAVQQLNEFDTLHDQLNYSRESTLKGIVDMKNHIDTRLDSIDKNIDHLRYNVKAVFFNIRKLIKEGQACTFDQIKDELQMPRSSLYRHLKKMLDGHIITFQKVSRKGPGRAKRIYKIIDIKEDTQC